MTLPLLAVAGGGDYLPGPVAEVNTRPPTGARAGDTSASLLQPPCPHGRRAINRYRGAGLVRGEFTCFHGVHRACH